MIFVTGDCHREFSRFNRRNFPEQKEMTKDDYVIICGDFGGVWDKDTETKEEKHLLDWLESKPFTTLFVSGNHENYDRLKEYPVEEWKGGKIQRIRPSVIHLMRGQVFQIDEKKIFTFGGASSHDISGGVFELDDPNLKLKIKRAIIENKPYRINHLTWWKEELPSEEEMREGKENLEANENEVDFIVTHCCSSSTQTLLSGGTFKADILTDYLEEIRQTVQFKKWFFGHYHNNKNINSSEILIYEQMIRIS